VPIQQRTYTVDAHCEPIYTSAKSDTQEQTLSPPLPRTNSSHQTVATQLPFFVQSPISSTPAVKQPNNNHHRNSSTYRPASAAVNWRDNHSSSKYQPDSVVVGKDGIGSIGVNVPQLTKFGIQKLVVVFVPRVADEHHGEALVRAVDLDVEEVGLPQSPAVGDLADAAVAATLDAEDGCGGVGERLARDLRRGDRYYPAPVCVSTLSSPLAREGTTNAWQTRRPRACPVCRWRTRASGGCA